MDRVLFAYGMIGVEAYPSSSPACREYVAPKRRNCMGEIDEEEVSHSQTPEEISDIDKALRIIQGKHWLAQIANCISWYDDAILRAELAEDRLARRNACQRVSRKIAEHHGFEPRYVQDVLFMQCSVYAGTPDAIAALYGIDLARSGEQIADIAAGFNEDFHNAKRLADMALD